MVRLLLELGVGTPEIVENLEFVLAVQRHHAVALVEHVLLAAFAGAELLGAGQAEFAQVDSLSQVGQKSFQINQALNVQNIKPMTHSHVVNVALDPRALLITEQANPQTFQSRLRGNALQVLLLIGLCHTLALTLSQGLLQIAQYVTLVRFILNRFEHRLLGRGRIRAFTLVNFFILLVFLRFFVLVERLHRFERLAAWYTLPVRHD